jgi:hypothetical protein
MSMWMGMRCSRHGARRMIMLVMIVMYMTMIVINFAMRVVMGMLFRQM